MQRVLMALCAVEIQDQIKLFEPSGETYLARPSLVATVDTELTPSADP